jgi:hypothetical protein
MPKSSRKLPPSAESMLPPDAPLPTELHLFSDYVYDAAERLRQSCLQGEVIERRYAADERPILRFLETLNEAGEPAALTKLTGLLRIYPMLLMHPFVWNLFSNLYHFARPHEEYNAYAQDRLVELVKAWAEGMTFGYQVSITRPNAGRGQSPQLFPHLGDRDGWLPSEEANEDERDAIVFRWAYDDLMARLKPCRPWRRDLHEFRDLHAQQRDLAPLVQEVAEDIGRVLESFQQDWRSSTRPLAASTLQRIVHQGLAVPKGRNPRHTMSCALLATLRWMNHRGHTIKLTPSLIDSTLETLRKYGITWQEDHTLRALPPYPQPKRVVFQRPFFV